MTTRAGLAVCVFCSSSQTIAEAYVELADEVGAEIARRGHTLISGGGSVSCMGAVARAARRGGAHTTGVIPEALLALEVTEHSADDLVVTVDMPERKATMDSRADAFLALPGGLGTLDELLDVWTSRTLGMHAKPVVVCDPDGVFAPLRDQIDRLLERGFMRAEAADGVVWATTPADALDAIESGVRRPPPTPTPGEVLEAEPGG
jgi:uncharacterized protein (TIGR00730 family)